MVSDELLFEGNGPDKLLFPRNLNIETIKAKENACMPHEIS